MYYLKNIYKAVFPHGIIVKIVASEQKKLTSSPAYNSTYWSLVTLLCCEEEVPLIAPDKNKHLANIGCHLDVHVRTLFSWQIDVSLSQQGVSASASEAFIEGA